MLRIAIVEDEERDYQLLYEYLCNYSHQKGVEFEISRFSHALNFISDYHFGFDLVFMDIALPDFDGMRAAEHLRKLDKTVEIIFVSQHARYAMQGYNVGARFFILKPVRYTDLSDKMDITIPFINMNRQRQSLLLNLPYEKRKIYTIEIKYIEIYEHDVVFHMCKEDIHVRGTLSEFEKKLDPKRFCRINSCYLINLSYITQIKERSVYIEDKELVISYARKKNLMNALSNSMPFDI